MLQHVATIFCATIRRPAGSISTYGTELRLIGPARRESPSATWGTSQDIALVGPIRTRREALAGF